MISGKIQQLDIREFTTKAGKERFKMEIVIDDVLYTTISKFPDVKFKVGDNVFFEVQEKYPTSIELGTLKKGTATHTAAKAPTDAKWQEMIARIEKLEEMAGLNDDIPF